MNELKIVNESEYTGEETSPAITFVNSEDGGRIVFAGNVAEYSKINNQEKSVEITEFGVTEIVPDKGYAGLSKVSVDTSAISGGSGEGDEWHYYKFFEPRPMVKPALRETVLFTLYKTMRIEDSSKQITYMFGTAHEKYTLIGFATNYSTRVSDVSQIDNPAKLITVGELVNIIGGYDNIFGEGVVTEITEEEFYDLTV